MMEILIEIILALFVISVVLGWIGFLLYIRERQRHFSEYLTRKGKLHNRNND